MQWVINRGLGAAILLLAYTEFSFGASGYVDRRAPTEEDIAQAQISLEEFLPVEYREYFLVESGHGYKGNQFAKFSTRVSDNASVVSRYKQITCIRLSRRAPWRCDGPSTQVFAMGHTFPEPNGIDDKTIAEIVDFIDSKCVYEQAQLLQEEGKWMGFSIGTGRRRISKISRSGAEYYSVRMGSHNLGIKRTDNAASACLFQIYGVGYSISMLSS